MTALLASVTGPEEAVIALNAGADIIDLKDPKAGALGALPAETIRATVRTVAARRPTSATVGDLPADPETLVAAVALTTKTGIDFVKVGFFGDSEPLPCIRALRSQTATGIKLVAVLFADLAPNLRVLQALAGAGFWGVMLDTANKQRGGLRDHMSHTHLVTFVRQARQSGLVTGLAGSLRLEDIPALVPLQPDYLGFRSALCCRGRRTNQVDLDAITAIRRRIQAPCDAMRHLDDLIE
jgi:dihydroneopterin aldolase